MKLILSSIFLVIISATQQCNDNKSQTKSSPAGWTDQSTQQTGPSGNQNQPAQETVTNPQNTTQQVETTQQQQQQQAQDPANFRLSVSFYSIGTGTDQAAREKFDKFIAEYTPKVTAQSKRWGREGEIDYCFRLAELTPQQQADFVKKAREVLASSKLVHVNENAPCRN